MFRYNTPYLMPWLIPQITWKMPDEGNNIYLTFDDGPHPEITPWVLKELDKVGAKATFFCVGDNMRKYPEVAEEIIQQGSRIGNHTYNHLDGWSTENFTYLKNILLCDKYTKSELFRPPYGKIGLNQLLAVKKKFKVIYWSILSRDFEKDLDIKESLDYMKENTGAGAIVLFHDSDKAEKNMKQMLPEFLKFFTEKGYKFKTL